MKVTEYKEYWRWWKMLDRCRNPKCKDYKYYGARGITVCEHWHKFENFYADIGDIPAGMTIDRIDNNQGYFKENVRLANRKQQGNNCRSNCLVDVKLNIKQWSELLNLNYSTIKNRKARGITIEQQVLNEIEKRYNENNNL